MKAVLTSLLLFSLVAVGFAADGRFTVNDAFAGTYYGTYKTRFATGPVEAQIRALGNNSYDGFMILSSVRDGKESIMTISKLGMFKVENGKAQFQGNHPNDFGDRSVPQREEFVFPGMSIYGDITPGRMVGVIEGAFFRKGDASLELVKSTPKLSPTLGAQAPANAVVLFDGKANGEWQDMKWKINDGALEVGDGNITTKKSFTNALLHIEFRTPYMPGEQGQARGNSGVYLRSVFEVQVLDSFGLFPLETNDSGGIYQVAAPDWKIGNACLPPGTWQTYDITYREANKTAKRPTTISVMHNGKLVVSNVEIPADMSVNGTGGGQVGGGFLMLQNHGNAVQYRNIWVQPID